MMQDYIRTSTYQRAMLDNAADFHDKVIKFLPVCIHVSLFSRLPDTGLELFSRQLFVNGVTSLYKYLYIIWLLRLDPAEYCFHGCLLVCSCKYANIFTVI